MYAIGASPEDATVEVERDLDNPIYGLPDEEATPPETTPSDHTYSTINT